MERLVGLWSFRGPWSVERARDENRVDGYPKP